MPPATGRPDERSPSPERLEAKCSNVPNRGAECGFEMNPSCDTSYYNSSIQFRITWSRPKVRNEGFRPGKPLTDPGPRSALVSSFSAGLNLCRWAPQLIHCRRWLYQLPGSLNVRESRSNLSFNNWP